MKSVGKIKVTLGIPRVKGMSPAKSDERSKKRGIGGVQKPREGVFKEV